MYDFIYTKAKPSSARLLTKISRINGMKLSDDIKELAKIDLVDFSQLPFALDKPQERVIQQCVDWEGRGLVLSEEAAEQARLGFAIASIRESQRNLVIISEKRGRDSWISEISKFEDHGTIVRYPSNKISENTKWVFASFDEVKRSKIFKEHSFDQIFLLDVFVSSHMLWSDNEFISGLFREHCSCLTILSPQWYEKDKGAESLRFGKPSSLTVVLQYYTTLNLTDKMHRFIHTVDGSSSSYLRTRGYLGTGLADLYPLLGIFTDLVI